MGIIDLIREVKTLREHIRELQMREQFIIQPVLHDYGLIGNIYDVYVSYMNEAHPEADVRLTIERSKFIFVVLALYSPNSLAGGKTRKGLREKLSRVTNCHSTLVSHNIKPVMFYYITYKDFRDDADKIMARVKEKFGHLMA